MILPITTIRDNNPILRTRSMDVLHVQDKTIQKLIDDMIPTMYQKDGVGLAAPQVGAGFRISVICPDPERYEAYRENKSEALVIINPTIISHSLFREEGEEGCLSVPEIFGMVRRWKSVTAAYLDRDGTKKIIKASGLLARCLQHEIDHLDGVLFVDRTKKLYHVPKL
ncbi:MAG: peptide deformylase [Patescibacteria group bacterium]